MEKKQLIQLAKKGDIEAFSVLYQQEYPFLFRYLLKVTMNIHEAEELAQDTLTKSYEKLSLFNGTSKFSTWLITIATNTLIDRKRKEKRQADFQKEKMATQMNWTMEQNQEDWNDVLACLTKLKESVRIPIVLKHYYGFSYEEIAHMLKVPIGTIKSRVHHGIEEMRKELSGVGKIKKSNISS